MAGTSTPLAFGLIGGSTLLIISGLKGVSIADVLKGNAGKPLNPGGGTPAPEDVTIGNDITSGVDTVVNEFNTNVATGVGNFDGKPVARWIIPYLKYGRQHGWKGKVNSGYRTYQEQQIIYNSGVRPAAKPGTSNHEKSVFPGGAVDVTDAANLSRILEARPDGSKLKWAGSKDPVHFSFPHNGSY